LRPNTAGTEISRKALVVGDAQAVAFHLVDMRRPHIGKRHVLANLRDAIPFARVLGRHELLTANRPSDRNKICTLSRPGQVTDMEITLRIPDELAKLLGTTGEIERRALEALALEEYKIGHLTKLELRRLLGFATSEALDKFLRMHDAYGLAKAARKRAEPAVAAPDEARRAKARQAAANIIARGKGIRLGGIKIKDLINEGRR
jgi:hypothetical protein